jgi:predicted ATP-dependent serine protease
MKTDPEMKKNVKEETSMAQSVNVCMNKNENRPRDEGKCKRGNEYGTISSEEHTVRTKARTRAFAYSTSSTHNYILASMHWTQVPQPALTCLSMSDLERCRHRMNRT